MNDDFYAWLLSKERKLQTDWLIKAASFKGKGVARPKKRVSFGGKCL